jgi:hypothetical protein
MSSSGKKQRERYLFDRARLLVAEWQGGDVDDAGETPDLVITTESHSFGVEVTEIIAGPARAELEAKRITLQVAQKRYVEATGVLGLGVHVVFPPGVRVSKSDQLPVGEELFRIVAQYFPSRMTTSCVKDLRALDDFESNWFSMIRLHFHPELTRSIWQEAAAHWVPMLSAAEIQDVISAKEGSVERYRMRAPICWLLVVANGFDAASAYSIDASAIAGTYESSFDGVILFDDVMNRAHRLALPPRS